MPLEWQVASEGSTLENEIENSFGCLGLFFYSGIKTLGIIQVESNELDFFRDFIQFYLKKAESAKVYLNEYYL